MSEYLQIYEVGPRDGLQNEGRPVSTDEKNKLVDGLVSAGLRQVELTSFVHPKAVPQMADADEVMARALAAYEGVRFTGLVFNEKGYDRAYAAGCRAMATGISMTETFSQRNTRRSVQEAMDTTRVLIERARRDGVWMRVYLMVAWVCPYEGHTSPDRVLSFADRVWEMGADELSLGDTIGYAHPLEVGQLVERIGRRLDMSRLAVHLHDTQALGLANAIAAIQAGVRIIDSSIGGLGGCPFAPGAAGNLATEDLVFTAYKMGLGTGVDFDALWQVVFDAEQMVGHRAGGRIRAWWESTCQQDPLPGRSDVPI